MRYTAILDGTEYEFDVENLAGGACRVSFGGRHFEVALQKAGASSFSVLVGERCFDFDVTQEGGELLLSSRRSLNRVTLGNNRNRRALAALTRPDAGGRAEIKAIMPGRIVNILAAPGAEVQAGDGVLVVEAMKMENEIKAPRSGKIVEVKVAVGQAVEKGELLAVIE